MKDSGMESVFTIINFWYIRKVDLVGVDLVGVGFVGVDLVGMNPRDTAGSQDPPNLYRKCMESADSTVQSQLQFVIETMDGTQTFCGCSFTMNTIRTNIGMPADKRHGELGFQLCVHIINGWVQGYGVWRTRTN